MGAPAEIRLVDPTEAWGLLQTGSAVLIDVRSRAEWAFVGVPVPPQAAGGLHLIEWAFFPEMAPNPRFAEEAERAIAESGASEALFLCRSGARSQHAAEMMQARFAAAGAGPRCANVVEGFEGDLDGQGRRGRFSGWKARGLPWRQS